MAYVISHGEFRQYLESGARAGGGDETDECSDEGDASSVGAAGSGSRRDTGGGGGTSEDLDSPWEVLEDQVEVLCGDRVLEPHLYVGE